MKTRTIVFGLLIFVASLLFSYSYISPDSKTGTVTDFTAGAGDRIELIGSDTYYIEGSGVGYFRIVSGSDYVQGSPITGDNFSGSGYLEGHILDVIDGSGTDYTISADNVFTATIYQSPGDIALYIILSLIFGGSAFIIGYLFLEL